MKTMEQVQDIRNRFYRKGESISEIYRATKVDRKTIRKYIDQDDFNGPDIAVKELNVCPILDPYKKTIMEWLEGDKIAPRKQRHTAKRVYARLQEEFPEYEASYRTVAKYFAHIRKIIFTNHKDSYLPLNHAPYEAQVDFGQADYYENGEKHTGKYLVVSYPKCNMGYFQLFPGENIECLFEGLVNIFNYVGAVPREIWFDNASTIVTEVLKAGKRNLTERFERFKEHYGFEAVFCNPGKGNEKGNVENKVGYLRRNLLVPVPRFLNLDDFNKKLLSDCDRDAKREHYTDGRFIFEIFYEDKKSHMPLPRVAFDTCSIKSYKTNGCGKFYLNKGNHEYSTTPSLSNKSVQVRFRSQKLEILNEDLQVIVTHRRLYGEIKQQSMQWLPYLKQLSLRPRSIKYSGIYDMMPNAMQEYVSKSSHNEKKEILKVLHELTERTGFDSALNTIDHALDYNASDSASLKSLYRRLYSDIPELPPMALPDNVEHLSQMPADLTSYDALLGKEVSDVRN